MEPTSLGDAGHSRGGEPRKLRTVVTRLGNDDHRVAADDPNVSTFLRAHLRTGAITAAERARQLSLLPESGSAKLLPPVTADATAEATADVTATSDRISTSTSTSTFGGDCLNKFSARALELGDATLAALGLNSALGLTNEQLATQLKQGKEAIETEILEHGDAADRANLEYVLHGIARDPAHIPVHVQAELDAGVYHGGSINAADFDAGHDGMAFADFVNHQYSRLAQLSEAHVLALRLYTSSSFRKFNGPLRAGTKPHPFRMAVYYLAEATKRLRAVSAKLEPAAFTQELVLWRGLKDLRVADGFVGGTE